MMTNDHSIQMTTGLSAKFYAKFPLYPELDNLFRVIKIYSAHERGPPCECVENWYPIKQLRPECPDDQHRLDAPDRVALPWAVGEQREVGSA